MGRPDLSTCFEHTHLPHGDDGKRVRGIIARCGNVGCTAAIPLPVNTMGKGGSQTDEVEWKFIAGKLEAKGWSIARRRQDHRCPRCVKNSKLAPAYEFRKVGNSKAIATPSMKQVKDAFMTTTITTRLPPSQISPAAADARTMSRDDRRIIFEKLNEVYVNERTGYSNGWSDERVAADLGVPRAWVRTIRDENFGDEITSEVTRKMIGEAKELVATIGKYRAVIENSSKALAPLFERADKIEKHLAEIAKVIK